MAEEKAKVPVKTFLEEKFPSNSSPAWILVVQFLYDRFDFACGYIDKKAVFKDGRVFMSAADKLIWSTMKYNSKIELQLELLNLEIQANKGNKEKLQELNDKVKLLQSKFIKLGTRLSHNGKHRSLGRSFKNLYTLIRNVLPDEQKQELPKHLKELLKYYDEAESILKGLPLDIDGSAAQAMCNKVCETSLDWSNISGNINKITQLFSRAEGYCTTLIKTVTPQIAKDILVKSETICSNPQCGKSLARKTTKCPICGADPVIKKDVIHRNTDKKTTAAAYDKIQEFIYNKLCDWYDQLSQVFVLEPTLKEDIEKTIEGFISDKIFYYPHNKPPLNVSSMTYDVASLLAYKGKKTPPLTENVLKTLSLIVGALKNYQVNNLKKDIQNPQAIEDIIANEKYFKTLLKNIKDDEKGYIKNIQREYIYDAVLQTFNIKDVSDVTKSVNDKFEKIGILKGTEEVRIICSNPDCNELIPKGKRKCPNCGKYSFYGKKDIDSPLAFRFDNPNKVLQPRSVDSEIARRTDYLEFLTRHLSKQGIGLSEYQLAYYFMTLYKEKNKKTQEYLESSLKGYSTLFESGKQLLGQFQNKSGTNVESSQFIKGSNLEVDEQIAEQLKNEVESIQSNFEAFEHTFSPIPFSGLEWSPKAVLWVINQIKSFNAGKTDSASNMIAWCNFLLKEGKLNAVKAYWLPWNSLYLQELYDRHLTWVKTKQKNLIYETFDSFIVGMFRKIQAKDTDTKEQVQKNFTALNVLFDVGMRGLIADITTATSQELTFRVREEERVRAEQEKSETISKKESSQLQTNLTTIMKDTAIEDFQYRTDPKGHVVFKDDEFCSVCGLLTPESLEVMKKYVDWQTSPIRPILEKYNITNFLKLGGTRPDVIMYKLIDKHVSSREDVKNLKYQIVENGKTIEKPFDVAVYLDLKSQKRVLEKQLIKYTGSKEPIEEGGSVASLRKEISELKSKLESIRSTIKNQYTNVARPAPSNYVQSEKLIALKLSSKEEELASLLVEQSKIGEKKIREIKDEITELDKVLSDMKGSIDKIESIRGQYDDASVKSEFWKDADLLHKWLNNFSILKEDFLKLCANPQKSQMRYFDEEVPPSTRKLLHKILETVSNSMQDFYKIYFDSISAVDGWSKFQSKKLSEKRSDYDTIYEKLRLRKQDVESFERNPDAGLQTTSRCVEIKIINDKEYEHIVEVTKVNGKVVKKKDLGRVDEYKPPKK